MLGSSAAGVDTVAIMQPTYLPWIGYFDLIDRVDLFLLLDDAEFSRQSWQQRNRIPSPSGLMWLTVPVLRRGRSKQHINEVVVNSTAGFPLKHIRAIEQNLCRSPFYDEYSVGLFALLEEGLNSGLCAMNIRIITWLCLALGIETPLKRVSTLGVGGRRSARLADLLISVGAARYLSPVGSQAYLLEDRARFDEAGIRVELHGYEHPVYSQGTSIFQPYAAAIDLLFNCGPASLDVIRSGRRPSTPLT